MQSIDFLPARYREQETRRHAKLWQLVLTLLFGSVVGLAVVMQFAMRLSVWRQLADLDAPFQQSQEVKQRFEKAQTEHQKLQHSTALYAYLNHPWPRTQILSQVISPLPKSIALREMKFSLEAERPTGPPSTTAPDPATAQQGEPAELDLKALRQQRDQSAECLAITGVAKDIAALHEYVATLATSSLVAKAELRSLETNDEADEAGPVGKKAVRADAARFVVVIQLKAGYGQLGGPRPADTSTAETTADATPGSAATDITSQADTATIATEPRS